ncbi:MAG TPA: zinc finger Ran-binding domain-containing protein [Candidatus Limnocylindrales bacterium]|nr:zinc finger Ran-binding domain-containing protein [Candidatus Limnocylindrales bacterium]
MTDVWVCGTCHSINRQRNQRCYKCGAAQEAAATGEMATLRQEQAIASRTIVAYRPAAALGLAASIFLIGLAAVSIAAAFQSFSVMSFADHQLELIKQTGTADEAALDALDASFGTLAVVRLAIILPLLVFFGAWLSRVVSNVPALGGGIPGTSPWRAFITTLIPGLNLRTVPGTIQDVLYRLDPKAGGFFMVAIAWVGLVGSWLASVIGGRYLSARVTFDIINATSLEDAVDAVRGSVVAAFILDIVTGGLIALGAVVLILLIVRIEGRSRARDAEVRAVAGV